MRLVIVEQIFCGKSDKKCSVEKSEKSKKCEVKTSSHYLLHCSNYSEKQLAFLNTIKNINMSILQQTDLKFPSVLLFGGTSFDNNKNTFILDATIDYMISTGRFDETLFNSS